MLDTKRANPHQTTPPDPARGGHYTVQDLRESPNSNRPGHDFNVRGYDGRGNLLLHTWHIGESSMQMECAAWESRGAMRRPFDPVKEIS
jgi:hypothetical protein